MGNLRVVNGDGFQKLKSACNGHVVWLSPDLGIGTHIIPVTDTHIDYTRVPGTDDDMIAVGVSSRFFFMNEPDCVASEFNL